MDIISVLWEVRREIIAHTPMNAFTRLAFIAVIWFVGDTAVVARIGETPEQLEERFGRGTKQEAKPEDKQRYDFKMHYVYDSRPIEVGFRDGKSVWEKYSRPSPATPAQKEKFSQIIKTLLAAQGEGQKWSQTGEHTFLRADGKVWAFQCHDLYIVFRLEAPQRPLKGF